MKSAFITGIEGFAGSHLAELLLKEGYRVCGTVLDLKKIDNIKHLLKRVKILECNILNYYKLRSAVKRFKPDVIFHLAGIASIPESFRVPGTTYKINFWGTYNLLESIRKYSPDTRVLIVGSAHEYGRLKEKELPVKESHPLKPETPYGASKAAAEMLSLQYYYSFGIKIFLVRSFNHIGPRQNPAFVLSSFAKQIAEIMKGNVPAVLKTGNLNVYRDFTDVRDVVNAYLLVVEKGKCGEIYNVCSGKAVKLGYILKKMLTIAGCRARVVTEKMRMRKSEMFKFYGDNTKLKNATGWKQHYKLEETITDLLDWWQQELGMR
jgi:GDP-4-dehydro-6-deoxy-D-mannose reductase